MPVCFRHTPNSLTRVLVCLLCVGMLVACGRTRPHQTPTDGGELLPPVAHEPAPVERIPFPDQTENIRQIHERIFQEAQDYYEEQEFQKAIKGFARLLALNPQADLEKEGHWWMGQSYDHMGNLEAAQEEYRQLASAPAGQRYQSHSSQRLKEIQGLLERRELPPKDTQAIRFAFNQLPGVEGFEQGILKMKQDGVTTLLIDLGCERMAMVSPVPQSAEPLLELDQLQKSLRSYADHSHRAGLLMYVGVNLRCLGNWATSAPLGWRDQVWQVESGTFQQTEWFDLFHPVYQEFLTRFLARLCKEGIDGLVLLNDYPLGLAEGVTGIGVKRFEQQFGVTFEPAQIFYHGFDPLQAVKGSSAASQVSGATTKDALFWRWAGWKARERLSIVETVVGRLRSQFPGVQFGLELHPHSLTDPVGALVKYAEDAMDAAGRKFSFFFVRPEIDRRSSFSEQSVIEKLRRISTKAVLDRLLPVLDNPRRVWVSMPAQGGQRIRSQATVNEMGPLQDFPSGIGVVHDLRAFS